jgi:hypothetical protein
MKVTLTGVKDQVTVSHVVDGREGTLSPISRLKQKKPDFLAAVKMSTADNLPR